MSIKGLKYKRNASQPVTKALVVVSHNDKYRIEYKNIEDCRSRELNNERTRILTALLHGERLSRAPGWNDCGVLKLPTRIGQVQEALDYYGIQIIKKDYVYFGKAYKTYSLSASNRKFTHGMWGDSI